MKKELDDILQKNNVGALLLFSESFKNPNMYYLTNFLAPDPLVFLKKNNNPSLLVVNSMEYSRAKKESSVGRVEQFKEFNATQIMKKYCNPKVGMLKLLSSIVKEEIGYKTKISVPYNFPSFATDILRNDGFIINTDLQIVEQARTTKCHEELKEIKKIQIIVETVVKQVISFLSNCTIDSKKRLFYKKNGKKEPLTIGVIKAFLGHKLLDEWFSIEEDIIFVCGIQSADPHYHGSSEEYVRANQPIILDIYPKSVKSRYYTDMTRTFVRGKASEEVKKMFHTVLEAKNSCIDELKEGVTGTEIYNLCCNILEKRGYETLRGGKKIEKGFIHGLGHGVGLEIHENPLLNEIFDFPLKQGSIVTIEPGLYDPRVGGVRIEDIVEITKNGCKNYTSMPVTLEI
jgi:Xaa-Pro aminopeptidase